MNQIGQELKPPALPKLMYQVNFKYNLIEDINNYIGCFKARKFLKKNNVVWYGFSLIRFFKIIFNLPKLVYHSDIPITCYWTTMGSNGAYNADKKFIYILPYRLNEVGETLYTIINHEIEHVKHEDDVKNMTHKEKENYISKLA
jgi:hypothetical protein